MAEHPDSDRLLSAVFPFAQQMLAKRGTFAPFGATMLTDGNIALAAGEPQEGGDAQQAIEVLRSGFTQQATQGTIRGAVVCYDGRAVDPQTGEKHDAVCAELEHATEGCATVFLPYRKRLFNRFTYGEVFGSQLQPSVFVR